MTSRYVAVGATTFALMVICAPIIAEAQGRKIEVLNLDAIVKNNPLQTGGETAAIIAALPASNNELGILVMSKNRLHHHDRQDHVLYLARGSGAARLENASGQIETRPINPGDILVLPRGTKHAFEKTGSENLVFLVVAGSDSDSHEGATFHE